MESPTLTSSLSLLIGIKYSLQVTHLEKYELTLWQHHDEWVLLHKGRASVTVEGKTVVVAAGDDPVFIPRWHSHSMLAFKGDEMILRERTDPTGEFKGL